MVGEAVAGEAGVGAASDADGAPPRGSPPQPATRSARAVDFSGAGVEPAMATCRPRPPDGLVDLGAAVEGLQLDIRYASARNFTGAALPGYEAAAAWATPETAAALARVQGDLNREGLGLVVYDAYRPRRATRAMVDWALAAGRADLLEQGYIARRSRHALGNTVDLSLVRLEPGGGAASVPVDMGSPFDDFSARSHHGAVGGPAGEARQTLRHAMRRRGFEAFHSEWWHYTYPQPGLHPRDVAYACP